MATQNTKQEFEIGFNDFETKKIESLHQLSSSRLVELLGKLDSHEHFSVHLRGRGLEIYGEVDLGTGMNTDKSFGIITSGYNLDKSDSSLYLVTFDYQNDDGNPLFPKTSLADVVRDYIVI